MLVWKILFESDGTPEVLVSTTQISIPAEAEADLRSISTPGVDWEAEEADELEFRPYETSSDFLAALRALGCLDMEIEFVVQNREVRFMVAAQGNANLESLQAQVVGVFENFPIALLLFERERAERVT